MTRWFDKFFDRFKAKNYIFPICIYIYLFWSDYDETDEMIWHIFDVPLIVKHWFH